MKTDISKVLGDDLQSVRRAKGLTQPALASRLGRDRARISELERDLRNGRPGRDRLTLLLEICDALDLVPMLVPRARAAELRALVSPSDRMHASEPHRDAAFDDVFIDLDPEDEE